MGHAGGGTIIQQQQTPSSAIGTPLYPLAGAHHQLATNIKFLSKQDREALLQYTKHFVRKAVQIVVQSRLGEKKPTKSRVYAFNTDWFNLSIKDLAQITTMTKSSLGSIETLFGPSTLPFCIEISLRTPENQTMILETWCILFNDQLADPTQKVTVVENRKIFFLVSKLRLLFWFENIFIQVFFVCEKLNAQQKQVLQRYYFGRSLQRSGSFMIVQ
jgi:hypothetical protein